MAVESLLSDPFYAHAVRFKGETSEVTLVVISVLPSLKLVSSPGFEILSVEDSVFSAALVSKDSAVVIFGMGANFAVSIGLFAAVDAMTVAGNMGFRTCAVRAYLLLTCLRGHYSSSE
jgi:hypothetical protein